MDQQKAFPGEQRVFAGFGKSLVKHLCPALYQ